MAFYNGCNEYWVSIQYLAEYQILNHYKDYRNIIKYFSKRSKKVTNFIKISKELTHGAIYIYLRFLTYCCYEPVFVRALRTPNIPLFGHTPGQIYIFEGIQAELVYIRCNTTFYVTSEILMLI